MINISGFETSGLWKGYFVKLARAANDSIARYRRRMALSVTLQRRSQGSGAGCIRTEGLGMEIPTWFQGQSPKKGLWKSPITKYTNTIYSLQTHPHP